MTSSRPIWPPSLFGNYVRRVHPAIAAKGGSATMNAPTRSAIVTLREITKESVRAVSLLDVGTGQEGLVAPNAFSIAQAHFHPEAWFRGVYADDTPVGFAMLEDWSLATGLEPELYEGKPFVALWRFMIDARYQKYGFGAQAMTLLIAHARARSDAANMLLSFVPKENNPEVFYQRFGFVRTGEEDQGELVMKLPLQDN
jgi:diamine N-acetyltransferase